MPSVPPKSLLLRRLLILHKLIPFYILSAHGSSQFKAKEITEPKVEKILIWSKKKNLKQKAYFGGFFCFSNQFTCVCVIKQFPNINAFQITNEETPHPYTVSGTQKKA